MTFSLDTITIGPKVRFLPFASDELVENIAQDCGGFPVDWGCGKGVYTPEQFKPVIADIRRQANEQTP